MTLQQSFRKNLQTSPSNLKDILHGRQVPPEALLRNIALVKGMELHEDIKEDRGACRLFCLSIPSGLMNTSANDINTMCESSTRIIRKLGGLQPEERVEILSCAAAIVLQQSTYRHQQELPMFPAHPRDAATAHKRDICAMALRLRWWHILDEVGIGPAKHKRAGLDFDEHYGRRLISIAMQGCAMWLPFKEALQCASTASLMTPPERNSLSNLYSGARVLCSQARNNEDKEKVASWAQLSGITSKDWIIFLRTLRHEDQHVSLLPPHIYRQIQEGHTLSASTRSQLKKAPYLYKQIGETCEE